MRISLLFLLVFGCYVSFAQSKSDKTIRTFIKDWENAWNSGKMDAHMSFYYKSDSILRITNKRGIKWGWQNIYDDFKKGHPDSASMGKTTVDIVFLKRLSRKFYFVVTKSGVQIDNQMASGFSSLLLQKIKGRWYIVIEH